MVDMPVPDLDRARTVEREEGWPDELGIYAKVGKKRIEMVIPAEQFFGKGTFHAPITGQWLIGAIDRLRRQKA